LECSFVSVPADPGAVVTARKVDPASIIANAQRARPRPLIARSPVLSREQRLAQLRVRQARTHTHEWRLAELETRKPMTMTAARWAAAISAADDREAQRRVYNNSFSAGRSQPISQAERIADYQHRRSELAA